MSQKTVIRCLERFKSAGPKGRVRRDYYRNFVPKMIYRTTKTENPEVSRRLVDRVLRRVGAA